MAFARIGVMTTAAPALLASPQGAALTSPIPPSTIVRMLSARCRLESWRVPAADSCSCASHTRVYARSASRRASVAVRLRATSHEPLPMAAATETLASEGADPSP